MFDSKHLVHRSADKPGVGKKTPLPHKPLSRIIFISIVLGGVAITAIVRGFDGRIEIKMGVDGGQVLIDGRKSPLSPDITNNSSSNE